MSVTSRPTARAAAPGRSNRRRAAQRVARQAAPVRQFLPQLQHPHLKVRGLAPLGAAAAAALSHALPWIRHNPSSQASEPKARSVPNAAPTPAPGRCNGTPGAPALPHSHSDVTGGSPRCVRAPRSGASPCSHISISAPRRRSDAARATLRQDLRQVPRRRRARVRAWQVAAMPAVNSSSSPQGKGCRARPESPNAHLKRPSRACEFRRWQSQDPVRRPDARA